LLKGDVIIGDLSGSLMSMKSRPTALRQLLHAGVNFSKALSNLAPSFALMPAEIAANWLECQAGKRKIPQAGAVSYDRA
jgi:hypothetical protein